MDITTQLNEVLLSMSNENNIKFIHEFRVAWSKYLSQPTMKFPEPPKKEEPKPEWEILSFKNKINDVVADVVGYQTLCNQYLLVPEIYSIHSVKRLSDNEVFTVGDKVQYKERIAPIQQINLRDNNITVNCWNHGADFTNGLSQPLSEISKVKEEPEPIKVSKLYFECHSQSTWDYVLEMNYPISIEKYIPIKEAIEFVLNVNDERLDPNTVYRQSYNLMVEQNQEILEAMSKMVSRDELREAEEKAFYAAQARDTQRGAIPNQECYPARYPTFSDYKDKK